MEEEKPKLKTSESPDQVERRPTSDIVCKIRTAQREGERKAEGQKKRERESQRERVRERERQREKTLRSFQRNIPYNREESVSFSKCVSDSVVSNSL